MSRVTPGDDLSLHHPHMCLVLEGAKASNPTTTPIRFHISPVGPAVQGL